MPGYALPIKCNRNMLQRIGHDLRNGDLMKIRCISHLASFRSLALMNLLVLAVLVPDLHADDQQGEVAMKGGPQFPATPANDFKPMTSKYSPYIVLVLHREEEAKR